MPELDSSAQTVRIKIIPDQVNAGAPPVTARKPRPRIAHPAGNRLKSEFSPTEFAVYHEIVQNIYDALIITDLEGNIVSANMRAVDFFLWPVTELTGKTIFEVVCGFDHAVMETVLHNLDNERFTMIEAFSARKDQTTFPSEIVTSEVLFGKGAYLCFFVRDVTQRKEAEAILQKTQEQLVRAERLELAGSIAGHIAHDFNNLLTPLLAYPEFIRAELPEGSPARQDLAVIEKTARRIADINQQLLVLSQRGYFEQTPININPVIEDVVALFSRSELTHNVEIKLELATNLHFIKGSSDQLLRVIENLCQNALEAMLERGGKLTITTANIRLDAPLKQYETMPLGEYIRVSITDTGPGISADIRSKIFDPFFTVKKVNRQRGSGLGLSIVHHIVKDHEGYIELESAVGKGTTFNLYFPACLETTSAAALPDKRSGTETIMLVDDDPLQLEVIARVLAKMGYSVISARSGEEATAAFEKFRERSAFPALVMLDMILDGSIDGAETYQRIKAIHPDQKAVIVSAYAETDRVRLAQSLGAGAFLRKPVSMEKLSQAIRQELDKA